MSVKTPAQTEKQFQAAVVEYANLRGWLTWHAYDSRRSTPGWPDLAMARRGRLVLAELKTERGRVSPEQRVWLDALGHGDELPRLVAASLRGRPARLTVCLWRPSMWDEIEETLA